MSKLSKKEDQTLTYVHILCKTKTIRKQVITDLEVVVHIWMDFASSLRWRGGPPPLIHKMWIICLFFGPFF